MMKIPTPWLRASALVLGLALPGALHAQTWQWASAHATGSTGSSVIYAAAVDATGNTVVAGQFSGTSTFGSTTLTSAGGTDVFVGRLSPTGAWLQAARAGGPADDVAQAVAVDAAGNIVAAGLFRGGTAAFGTTTLTNANSTSSDGFVARLSSAGTWTQAVRMGGSDNDGAMGLALDGSGTTIVAGNFSSNTATFGATTLTNANTDRSNDVFVARLGADGTWGQAIRGGGSGDDFVQAIVLDATGNALIAGHFARATVTFGTIVLNNANPSQYSSDIYVARLSSAGTWTQALQAGGPGNDYAKGAGIDASGNAYVAGNFASPTLNFGTTVLTNADASGNTSDIFVARLSSANAWTMAARAGGSSNDYANALAVDGSGKASVGGLFQGLTSTFGAIALTNADPTGAKFDILVARLSSAGSWDLALRAGGVGDDYTNALALDASGNAAVGGNLNSSPATFGDISLNSSGSAFIAKLMGLTTKTTAARLSAAMQLVPNPAQDQVKLSWPTANSQSLPLILIDNLGREVKQQALPAQATRATLSLRGLASGVYVVRVGETAQRLVVE
ncbi:T9SS C-terminal target domain-containing protein [Hymenobacter sediminis]|uniref:T9SS type A sorting domain-containing protein n=1 Tax=Hymenobacter sediminis TaxID=2218621 RepID=UPI000DA69A54|nr:T9SS type A sorting domain-containing protein [Hymenobacter sediminis]RPD49317.1 T9SS C-terminal target domain-containing protein [Hymenobacter sediminis]